MTRHARTAVALGAALLLLAAGCSSDDSADTRSADDSTTGSTSIELPEGVTPGLPDGVERPVDSMAGAGWDSDGTLWVVTVGSSTNPTLATKAVADGQDVTVTLSALNPDGPATMDLQPTTSLVEVSGDIDAGATVWVTLGSLGTVEVADADTPGWLPASEG